MPDHFYAISNWVGTAVGVLVAMWYFLQKGLSVCSLLHIGNGKKLTNNEPKTAILSAYLINVIVAFVVILVFYEGTTERQFGFAAISIVSLLSGHMSFTEFRKLHSLED